jgi:hypothetical protein
MIISKNLLYKALFTTIYLLFSCLILAQSSTAVYKHSEYGEWENYNNYLLEDKEVDIDYRIKFDVFVIESKSEYNVRYTLQFRNNTSYDFNFYFTIIPYFTDDFNMVYKKDNYLNWGKITLNANTIEGINCSTMVELELGRKISKYLYNNNYDVEIALAKIQKINRKEKSLNGSNFKHIEYEQASEKYGCLWCKYHKKENNNNACTSNLYLDDEVYFNKLNTGEFVEDTNSGINPSQTGVAGNTNSDNTELIQKLTPAITDLTKSLAELLSSRKKKKREREEKEKKEKEAEIKKNEALINPEIVIKNIIPIQPNVSNNELITKEQGETLIRIVTGNSTNSISEIISIFESIGYKKQSINNLYNSSGEVMAIKEIVFDDDLKIRAPVNTGFYIEVTTKDKEKFRKQLEVIDNYIEYDVYDERTFSINTTPSVKVPAQETSIGNPKVNKTYPIKLSYTRDIKIVQSYSSEIVIERVTSYSIMLSYTATKLGKFKHKFVISFEDGSSKIIYLSGEAN